MPEQVRISDYGDDVDGGPPLRLREGLTEPQCESVKLAHYYLDLFRYGSRAMVGKIAAIPPEKVYRSWKAVRPMRKLAKMVRIGRDLLEPARELWHKELYQNAEQPER